MRVGRGLLVTAGLAAGGIVVATGPVAPAFASGQECAGIVIDDGTGATPDLQGASVSPGSSDLDILDAAGDTFTQNDSGLVCAINDYPANGLQSCLSTKHGLYYYWSYWEGDPTTNTWTYANVGPAEHTVAAGQSYVEGWRYQDPGADSPLATKPSVTPAAAFAAACQSVTGVTTTTAAPPGSGGAGTTTAPTSAATRSPAPETPTTTKGPGTNRSQPESAPATTTPHDAGGPSALRASGAQDSSTTTSSGDSSSTGKAQPRTAAQLAASHQAGRQGSGSDPVVPVVVVIAIIGLLGTAAWLRWRRAPRGA